MTMYSTAIKTRTILLGMHTMPHGTPMTGILGRDIGSLGCAKRMRPMNSGAFPFCSQRSLTEGTSSGDQSTKTAMNRCGCSGPVSEAGCGIDSKNGEISAIRNCSAATFHQGFFFFRRELSRGTSINGDRTHRQLIPLPTANAESPRGAAARPCWGCSMHHLRPPSPTAAAYPASPLDREDGENRPR